MIEAAKTIDGSAPLSRLRNALAETARCPVCHAARLAIEEDIGVRCTECSAGYVADFDIGLASLIQPLAPGDLKNDVQAWWGDLYEQAYAGHEDGINTNTFIDQLTELEDLFMQRQHLAVAEMPLNSLSGKQVLEIGPGSGAHSALFKRHGAQVTAADITPARAAATARKLNLLPGEGGVAFQADAENLPFQDDRFDIVYSNGVLHHSPDTARCIDEVHRVLKPGGQAILMLYSRHSATYWLNILPRAFLTGEFFRWPEAQWIGRLTEGRPKFGDTKNPITRVYSANELRSLMQKFQNLEMRKTSFQFDNFCIPRLSQLRQAMLVRLGHTAHPAGRLVYGAPFVPETKLEQWLGRALGFAWNIVAEK